MPDLSVAEARRIALAAQGFADPLPKGKATKRHLHRVMQRTGVLQLDSVNIVARPQFVVPYSRIGPYPPELLHQIAYHDRDWFEYWGHEASLIPVERYPLFRSRMEWIRRGVHKHRPSDTWDGYMQQYLKKNRPYMDAVLKEIAERGALGAGQITDGGKSMPGVMWGWSKGKRAVEMLFRGGEVSASRRPTFERIYDLPERVLPKAVLDAPVPDHEDAERALVEIAMRSLGIATSRDIADYYRTKPADAKRRADELVDGGTLQRVTVDGWKEPGYLARPARVPRTIDRSALVTPFDPMVWDRKRALRLFGFDYKIEIYVPAPKRKYGYYVLPFLHREHFVARVDLKADRAAGVLRVLGAWKEPTTVPDDVEALGAELSRFAGFLGLERVTVAPRGNLARPLKALT